MDTDVSLYSAPALIRSFLCLFGWNWLIWGCASCHADRKSSFWLHEISWGRSKSSKRQAKLILVKDTFCDSRNRPKRWNIVYLFLKLSSQSINMPDFIDIARVAGFSKVRGEREEKRRKGKRKTSLLLPSSLRAPDGAVIIVTIFLPDCNTHTWQHSVWFLGFSSQTKPVWKEQKSAEWLHTLSKSLRASFPRHTPLNHTEHL